MKKYIGYYRHRDLKNDGWDQRAIDEYIGEPDKIAPSPQKNGGYIRLYEENRVNDAKRKKDSDEKIIRDSIPERPINMIGFIPIHAMLDVYEQMLIEDMDACMGEPDSSGWKDLDDDKYDEMCMNNPRSGEYIKMWESIKRDMIREWNTTTDDKKDPRDLADLIGRIEDIRNNHRCAPGNVIETTIGEYETFRSLTDLLNDTDEIKIDHEFPSYWHIEHLSYIHDTITIMRVTRSYNGGTITEYIKSKGWY